MEYSVAAAVRSRIKSIGRGVAFTVKHFLDLGEKNPIYIELFRQVRSCAIKRLARGEYIVPDQDLELPSALELATLKAERFGKQIAPQIGAENNNEVSFITDGCKSSFDSIHGRLFFKHAAPAKLKKLKKLRESSRIQNTDKNDTSSEGPRIERIIFAIGMNLIRMLKDRFRKKTSPES